MLEAKNSALTNTLFSIWTIEPIAKIGAHMVYDLELHAESTEPQFTGFSRPKHLMKSAKHGQEKRVARTG